MANFMPRMCKIRDNGNLKASSAIANSRELEVLGALWPFLVTNARTRALGNPFGSVASIATTVCE